MVYGIAYQYMGNKEDAEDAYQETFFTYFKKERQFESDEHLKAWLIKVTISKCKDILLKRKYPLDIEELEIADDEKPFSKEEVMDLKDAINKLKFEYKEAILLFYMDGMSIKEIANILDVTENVVKLRLSRGRKKLKEFLTDEEES